MAKLYTHPRELEPMMPTLGLDGVQDLTVEVMKGASRIPG